MNLLTHELLNKCADGDRRSQCVLYELMFGTLMGISRRYYKNREDRTEIVNVTFLKVLKSLKDYKMEGSFEAWCKRILMNCIIDDYRKNRKRKEIMEYGEISDFMLDQSDFMVAESVFSAEDLEKLLFRLPDTTRYVFNLFALEEYSHAEIAGQLGMSEGTSRWHVCEARKLLKSWLLELLSGNSQKDSK